MNGNVRSRMTKLAYKILPSGTCRKKISPYLPTRDFHKMTMPGGLTN